ncbi:DNA polymerase delta subunit 2 [Galendromus occidentalis]|uniref:DNA polymerase delta subunit 2 n=1 Tax=Galendromus occidentalis TaxID=34638 RepID=A0AAJ6QS05_9ACAR|nr:DNA polymerase delta subunit 2 [Galendromus occidentalis]
MSGVQGDFEEKEFSRTKCDFKSLSTRFELCTRDFRMQYANLYKKRYERCLPALRKRVDEEWGSSKCPIEEVCNLKCGVQTIVMGTLFKTMPKQPSILREISEDIPEDAECTVEPTDNFTSDEDELVLEDLRQRVAIRSSDLLSPHKLVTGVPIALMGAVDEEDAHFVVKDVLYIGIRNQPPVPTIAEDKYVVFISGLNLSSNHDLTPFQLFVDYLTGMIGSNKEVERTARVCKVFICGNSVAARSESEMKSSTFSLRKEVPDNAPFMNILDAYLNALSKSVPVDIMPGDMDPTNNQLPQQPLNQVLFPRSAVNGNLTSVTNPHEFEIDGVRFLGTSGQNVADILRYSRLPGPLDALEAIVRWCHLIPSAPDTTPAYPQQQTDPFVIEETPHVLFAGNQPEFQAKIYTDEAGRSVLLLSIPAFWKTPTCVWLNLRTLEASKLDFIIDEPTG